MSRKLFHLRRVVSTGALLLPLANSLSFFTQGGKSAHYGILIWFKSIQIRLAEESCKSKNINADGISQGVYFLRLQSYTYAVHFAVLALPVDSPKTGVTGRTSFLAMALGCSIRQ